MSEQQVAVKPAVNEGGKAANLYNNGKVADFFFQRELMPLSLEESIPVLVLQTKDETKRTMRSRETGNITELADQSKVTVAGGMELIVRGGGHKKAGNLPPEGEFALVQIDTVVNKEFGSVKYYLKKWRAVDDIRALTDGRAIGLPLRFHKQLVSSVVSGYDFNIVAAEGE